MGPRGDRGGGQNGLSFLQWEWAGALEDGRRRRGVGVTLLRKEVDVGRQVVREKGSLAWGPGPWKEGSGSWGLGTGLVQTLAEEKGWHAGQKGVMAAEAGEERREELGAGGAGDLRIMGMGG